MIVSAFISVHALTKQRKIDKASVFTKRLSITCEVNKKIVDFFDVRFNLNDQIYEPYEKPNNDPVYINKHSNHPSNIIDEVPKTISKCLTSISCNKNVFFRNIGIENRALKNSGFDQTLTYD